MATVYDLTGKKVATITSGKDVFVPTGVYFVKVDDHPARKVVVMR